MSRSFHSIRWRVQLWHGVILLLAVAAFCLTAHQLARNNQQRRIDRELFDAERLLIRGIILALNPSVAEGSLQPPSAQSLFQRLESDPPALPADVVAKFVGKSPGYFYFLFLAPDGRAVFHSDNIDPADVLSSIVAHQRNEELRTVGSRRESVRTVGEGRRTVIGRDLTPDLEEMRRLTVSLAAAGLGVWLVGLIGGWWLAGRAIQPITTISRTATRIADGNLTERISTTGTDSELDQLSRVLNATFDRLEKTFERQKQFTADASHELRTPVTILLSEIRRILKRERTPEEYRAVLTTCQDAAERMRRLIEALLLLAREENRTVDPAKDGEPCDLADLARQSTEHLRPLATDRQIVLKLDLAAAPCRGDSAALLMLIDNLLSNALKHHTGAGIVKIATGSVEGRAHLSVTDDGPGIAAEDLPHIFNRFFRGDKSRASKSDHSGLGLAIARTIAENHSGHLSVENQPGRGARFTFSCPATRPLI